MRKASIVRAAEREGRGPEVPLLSVRGHHALRLCHRRYPAWTKARMVYINECNQVWSAAPAQQIYVSMSMMRTIVGSSRKYGEWQRGTMYHTKVCDER